MDFQEIIIYTILYNLSKNVSPPLFALLRN